MRYIILQHFSNNCPSCFLLAVNVRFADSQFMSLNLLSGPPRQPVSGSHAQH